ncbi:hypothetical protein [uncultured Rhodospira sp.]|uniref:hypothetical protein n=1 Tax=uncultured Rhodospira sp. TaxID=1936189 RepID=UPI00260EC94B|nr:hypothetical protein [uncultured Rhodospira sp.]
MRRDARVLLWDIQQAAEAISRFMDGVNAETYARDDLIQAAVDRLLEESGPPDAHP